MRTVNRTLLLLLVVSSVSAGCAQPVEPSPEPIRLDGLDLTLGSLPPSWTLEDEGASVRFTPADPSAAGDMELSLAEASYSLNLVAAVDGHRATVENREGERYFGRQELMTQLGTAFTSRAERLTEDGPVGEVRIFALHPRNDAIIRLTAHYPAGDDPATRVQAAIEVFSLIE